MTKLVSYNLDFNERNSLANISHIEGDLYTYRVTVSDQKIRLLLMVDDWELFRFVRPSNRVIPFIFRHCTLDVMRVAVRKKTSVMPTSDPLIGTTLDGDKIVCAQCKEPVPQPLLTFAMLERFSPG